MLFTDRELCSFFLIFNNVLAYLALDLVTDAGNTNARSEKESGLFGESDSVGYIQILRLLLKALLGA